ncbi:Translin [Mycena floridula]|nr:Translin [Mycena floridula]
MDPTDLDNLNAMLDQESDLREKIKDQVAELDKKTRTMVGTMSKIHSTPVSELPALIGLVQPVLLSCQENISQLANLIPPNQFWRWKNMWSNSLQTCVFITALVEYLSHHTLISLPQTAQVLGINDEWKDRVSLPAEDYLHGLITLVNELSRLAVNAVTLENFEEPFRIAAFVKEIFAGFSMLNLKNDALRRRFDSLKYDLKKIEEVVYDVSLRKLAPQMNQPPASG